MRTLALFMVCALAGGCGKDETPPETIPFKELTAQPKSQPKDDDAADNDSDTAPEEDNSGGSTATAAQPAPASPNPAAPKPASGLGGGSIDNCCGALNVQARIETDATKAARYRQAAGACSSISAMVKAGKTSRESALRQVRALAGNNAPGSCR